MNTAENAQSCSVNNDIAWQKTFPPGFQDMLEFSFIEALTGRRARRFFMGAEIPDGVLAYKSRHDPVPLSELEKLLVVTACGGNTGWHHMLYRAKLYAPHLSNYSGAAGGRTFPSAAVFHTSNTFFTDDEGVYLLDNPIFAFLRAWVVAFFPKRNVCPLFVGRDFKLDETIKLAVNAKNAVCMWGPYEISKESFDLGVKRLRLLDGGTIKYRADDRLYRKDRIAINCFHAMAGLYELYPNGGIFGTGFKMWGLNGTARVLIEYTAKASDKGVLLEPVDEKKGRFGFIYAPTRNSHDLYNPFKSASAYRR